MESKGIKIYTAEATGRLRYIARLLLEEILGLRWEIVTDRRRLGKSPVINYSDDEIKGSLKIEPDTLLFETGTREREIKVTSWRSLPVFFQTSSASDIPFDIFAAAFYLVTRYEEYLDFEPDKHGRYPADHSLAFRNGFLRIPVVDLWTWEFARVLIKRFPVLVCKRSTAASLVTVDVDEAFAFRGNTFLSSLGEILNGITHHVAKDRVKIAEKGDKDPYDNFDYLTESIKKNGCNAKFFFPVGDHNQFDNNPGWRQHKYRNLITGISGEFSTGIHFSYKSASDSGLMKIELARLKTITGKSPVSSRLHFLRLRFPETYRNLINVGITEDYSMGYPEEPGFRAGIARSFNFYDLREEKETGLRIIPFQVMDSTLSEYKKMDAGSAMEVFKEILNMTKQARGLFVCIWHNTSLLDKPEHSKWRDLFEYTLSPSVISD